MLNLTDIANSQGRIGEQTVCVWGGGAKCILAEHLFWSVVQDGRNMADMLPLTLTLR